ncbi:hypothetical protein HGO38_28330 [Rhizobium sp. CG5]|uniref:hypothetical protein n=1 Tax=Rhizobium sp. CG5 TaxID=2726076 RepID=UPI002033852D|nr:hypothetical protein [Rhizobium sp. CG5]MCM2477358.1 hypothetical protein [Rhizobium sp. CG5]
MRATAPAADDVVRGGGGGEAEEVISPLAAEFDAFDAVLACSDAASELAKLPLRQA